MHACMLVIIDIILKVKHFGIHIFQSCRLCGEEYHQNNFVDLISAYNGGLYL